MTWKFIYTYWERCKTGPTHNRCWNWSPFTSKHTWMRFSKFWNTFPKMSTLTAWNSWRIASLSCSIVRGVFLYTLPFNRPQRNKSAGVRSASPCLWLFNQFLDATLRWCTSFIKFRSKCRLAGFKWTCLPVFTNETVCIDNSLGPLAIDSPCRTHLLLVIPGISSFPSGHFYLLCRHACETAKSNYHLRNASPSVRVKQLDAHWTDF